MISLRGVSLTKDLPSAGRVLCGLQVGAVSLGVPRFLAEIAPPRVRGSVGSSSQVLVRASAQRA